MFKSGFEKISAVKATALAKAPAALKPQAAKPLASAAPASAPKGAMTPPPQPPLSVQPAHTGAPIQVRDQHGRGAPPPHLAMPPSIRGFARRSQQK